jgi:GDP-mannose transporter
MADEKKRDDFAIEMGDRGRNFEPPPVPRTPTAPPSPLANNPVLPILAYCGSSILMTVTNKYVLSGLDFNLNFFLLCVQV